MTLDETHDPARSSWVDSANGHPDFPVQNLPFGIFSDAESGPRPGLAIGDSLLDLKALAALGVLPDGSTPALHGQTLNAMLALASVERVALRRRLSTLLSQVRYRGQLAPLLRAAADCTLHLPVAIGDYTDFYAGIHHAETIGRLFRPDNPLLPNYKYVPIGYHGRASSIRPSGVPVIRPNGQRKPPGVDAPTFGPSHRLDYELELGIWVGPGNALGQPISIARARDHIAGFCLLNDWSARDLQSWEYQPLGPFLAKSFHTTISPWIITAEALAPFRIAQPKRPDGDPRPLDYLWDEADQRSGALGLDLTVSIRSEGMRKAGMPPYCLSHACAANLYWTVAQMITHHASNGCNMQPGDLLGSGTISSPEPGGSGSLIEISRNGAETVTLPTGEIRTFLEDHDEVLFSAHARAEGYASIGFGPCRAEVRPPP